ncbi:MAG: toll/interleukin-1 receptor domain-containing protein [Saprospiraceae bacterium]
MAAFRIFLSHAHQDLEIAQAIEQILNNAFAGELRVFLAQDNIVGGNEWKTELKKNIKESDAIISLVTEDSVSAPWIYVEWSPFWINDKQFYVLITPEVNPKELLHPMTDRQIINLGVRDSVHKFFQALINDSKAKKTSIYDRLDDFIIEVEKALDKKEDAQFGIYRRLDKKLPAKDSEKATIAQFFYDRDEMDHFIRVTKAINNDELVVDFIYAMFRDSKMEHKQELHLALELSKNMNRASSICNIVLELINLDEIDAAELFEMVDMIADRSQDSLSLIAIRLMKTNKIESQLFDYLVNDKISSKASIRNLAIQALRIGPDGVTDAQFMNIVDSCTNSAELKNIALEFIRSDAYKMHWFDFVIEFMISRGGMHLDTVNNYLSTYDSDFASEYFTKKRETHGSEKLKTIFK